MVKKWIETQVDKAAEAGGFIGVILFALIFLIAAFIGWPLLVIWAMNTLFQLGIAYSLTNVAAVIVMSIAVKGLRLPKE